MTKGNNNAPKTEYSKTSEWKNWLVFINNTHNKLNELEEIGSKAYFDKKYLNMFYAKLTMFITPRMSYVDHPEKITKYLDKIGKDLFNPEYLRDLQSIGTSPQLQSFQHNMMTKLNRVFGDICQQLSSYELIPKVKKVKIVRQKKHMEGTSL